MVECHCVLPQFRNSAKPKYHNFVVFSILDDSGSPIPKHARCNNCGVIHNIIDLCKSEIIAGHEEGAVIEIEDIELMLPESITNILKNYDCDVPTWEQALFIVQNAKWGSYVILKRNYEKGIEAGKLLRLNSPGNYRIEPFSTRREI